MKKLYLFSLILLPFILLAQKSTNEWTVVATYEIPGKAGGITYDGEFLYSGLYSSDGDDSRIFKIDPADGSYELQCIAPIEEALGLSFDGTHFWSTDRQGSYDPALAVEFDMDGNFISNFELPATYISGIESMEDGSFWVNAYYDPNGTAFHVDDEGNELGQFSTPNDQPWAICQMGDDFWIADYDADMLYLVDDAGQVIESHESVGIKPTGVVFDGTYLWYVTGPSQANSTLYKINLSGGGNPVLDIQAQNINLGDQLVDSNTTFELEFTNTGGSEGIFTLGDLTGMGGNIIELTGLPETLSLAPSSSETISISVDFIEAGIIDLIQEFTTNDPVNQEIEIHIFGQSTYDGPLIAYDDENLAFDDVRKFASTRRYIKVMNTGNENLVIDEIYFNNAAFYIDEYITTPIAIPSLDTLDIGVWFFPQTEGDFSTELFISTNTSGNPPIIEFSANAINTDNGIGSLLWSHQITDGYDQSPKAMLGIEDVSGDNVGDVIVCAENNQVICLNGNSSGTADVLWTTEIYSGNVYQQNGIDYLDDIDEDGYDDFIIGTAGGDRAINCISAKTGEILWKFQTNVIGDGGWVYQVYGQKDVNGDGINDALAAVGDDANDVGPKCIFLIDGNTGEQIWRCALNGPGFGVIAVEDFTGDGQVDVIGGGSNNAETQGKVFGIDGSNGQIEWDFNVNGTSVWALAPLGDLNNDNVPDIMAGDFSGQYYFLDATNGNEIENGSIGNNLILRLLNLGDISEDGFDDILIASSSTNTYLIDGYTADAVWSANLDDKSWNVAVANDLNEDGFNDVMVGSLFSNNYSYFLDGATGDEMSKKAAASPIDALCSTDDACRDYTIEMVVGDRDGLVSCYSGGIDGTVSIPENDNLISEESNSFSISPNPIINDIQINTTWNSEERVDLVLVETASGKSWSLGSQEISQGDNEFNISISSSLKSQLSSGLYFIKLKGKDMKKAEKMIYLKK
ncbi:PQQ-binding-like beta-propeller repeat protein [Lentimicrobium sp. L6]|uniref:outer membrane protein assembly factor BamB family protein n=1 Tax=Lentimicrobium sp. L6 TaxID=2735916 RepID=UPI001552A7AC|nr:PQQ-binding-like beta-propeller repeat protein [Lentimicrobium sp. L6]NPD86372.1 PQQ-binding-like beta-propeller repeat protein [Lentimicrobium sp. L6]